MKYSNRMISAAHSMAEAVTQFSKLTDADLEALTLALDEGSLPASVTHGFRRLMGDDRPRRTRKLRNGDNFGEFRFEETMQRLRNAVMHSSSAENAAELDWLLKIILTSPVVFESVRELDNFLSNMAAVEHSTKSTGRDRVVEWYFRHINAMPDSDRNRVYLKIARHIFAQSKSNYREWKEVLYGGGGR